MKRIHWLIIGIFICALVGVFITSNNGIIAQEEPTPTPDYSYIVVEAARVRAAPSETSLSIGTLLRNARVTPYNRDESGNWVLVDYANSFGWIRRDLAVWVEDIDAL
ncbi:MAG: SH3 domain-containing protein, partial [Anaerolineae bacterium]|nr:SH3 domain-containing protein [Anaerolineae bacterium]